MPLPYIEPARPDTFLESVLLCRPAVHVAGRCIPSGCRYLMEKFISYPVPLSLSVRLTVNVEFPTTAPASRPPVIAEEIVDGRCGFTSRNDLKEPGLIFIAYGFIGELILWSCAFAAEGSALADALALIVLVDGSATGGELFHCQVTIDHSRIVGWQLCVGSAADQYRERPATAFSSSCTCSRSWTEGRPRPRLLPRSNKVLEMQ